MAEPFLPEPGFMTVLCCALAALDSSLIVFLVRQVIR